MDKIGKILKSWEVNSDEWIKIIDQKGIESRKITNMAIVTAIESHSSPNVLDCGCGEGWLTRELIHKGFSATGIDATKALIEDARKKGKGKFHQLSYEEIISGQPVPEAPFDSIVLNFCLYEKNVSALLKGLQNALVDDGIILIQTIHPFFLIKNGMNYESQWIDNSWKGLKGNFTYGHSWYARTMADWYFELKKSNLALQELIEPINDQKVPASIIFILKKLDRLE